MVVISTATLAFFAQRELAQFLLGFVAFTALRHLGDDISPATILVYTSYFLVPLLTVGLLWAFWRKRLRLNYYKAVLPIAYPFGAGVSSKPSVLSIHSRMPFDCPD